MLVIHMTLFLPVKGGGDDGKTRAFFSMLMLFTWMLTDKMVYKKENICDLWRQTLWQIVSNCVGYLD